MRQVRFVDTAVGVIPTQVDYSDYRAVAGVKVPFHRVITWTDGRSTIELSQVQPNVRVDATRFINRPRHRQNREPLILTARDSGVIQATGLNSSFESS